MDSGSRAYASGRSAAASQDAQRKRACDRRRGG